MNNTNAPFTAPIEKGYIRSLRRLMLSASLSTITIASHAATSLVGSPDAARSNVDTQGANGGYASASNQYAVTDTTSFVVGGGYSYVDGQSIGGLDGTMFYQMNSRTMLLAHLSAAQGEGDFRILSGGLGARRMVGDGGTMLGVNAFFDKLQDRTGFSYNQIGAGVEASRGRWFFDANGYLPIGSTSKVVAVDEESTISEVRKATPSHPIEVRRVQTQITRFDREAMKAVDAEIGYRVINKGTVTLTVAAGYYRAWAGDVDSSGVRARAQLGIGQHLSLGAEWRQNGDAIGQEWRLDASAHFAIGRSEIGAPVRDEITAALHDGKAVSPVAYSPTRSGKEALHVMPSSGKSAKFVQPVLPPPVVAPVSEPNMLFFAPIQRTPWPMTALQSSVNFSEVFTHHRRVTPPAGCACGPDLIFD